jgi:molybdopterin converting factor subunit 1
MVSVRLFAGFKEKLNRERVEISVPPNTTLDEFIKRLGDKFPELADVLRGSRATIAVNHEVVEMDYVIKEDDEIALFPPVSGG